LDSQKHRTAEMTFKVIHGHRKPRGSVGESCRNEFIRPQSAPCWWYVEKHSQCRRRGS